MKRTAIVLFSGLLLAFAVARGDDEKPKPDDKQQAAPPPATTKKDGAKAPDPANAALVGSVLAPGTVKREKLFPLDEGRAWSYELKTWLSISGADESAPEESEPPRTHKLDVSVGESAKVAGKDAKCLEYRLDGEVTQRAYYLD